jgi:hypothetical protein
LPAPDLAWAVCFITPPVPSILLRVRCHPPPSGRRGRSGSTARVGAALQRQPGPRTGAGLPARWRLALPLPAALPSLAWASPCRTRTAGGSQACLA